MKPTCKITFVGAHGTGKTTLVTAVAVHLRAKGIAASVVPEIPRFICTKAGDPEFFRRDRNTALRQSMLLLGQPVFEAELERSTSSIILCDRAILDHWAYTKVLHARALHEEGVTEVIDEFVSRYCKLYRLFFYVPIEFSPVDDGTREDDGKFQHLIDAEIQQMLSDYNLSYTTVKGTLEERTSTVLETLHHNGLLVEEK